MEKPGVVHWAGRITPLIFTVVSLNFHVLPDYLLVLEDELMP